MVLYLYLDTFNKTSLHRFKLALRLFTILKGLIIMVFYGGIASKFVGYTGGEGGSPRLWNKTYKLYFHKYKYK